MPEDRSAEAGLLSIAPKDAPLTAAQLNFNKLTAQLEKARARMEKREKELHDLLAIFQAEAAPLEAELNVAEYEIITRAYAVLDSVGLDPDDKELVLDAIYHRATGIMQDGTGLTHEQIGRVREIMDALEVEEVEDNPAPGSTDNNSSGPPGEPPPPPPEAAGYAEQIKHLFRTKFGVDLDLSDMDYNMDPDSFQAEVHRRINDAMSRATGMDDSTFGHAEPRPRKRTKAQEAKARRLEEAENAKRMDLKTLYKQLAKVLHPDLETDPARKLQKQEWMQRLTKAHAAGDLHELLSIEMQWLGVESSNLATATDEKLAVYAMVLKEQIAEIKLQTRDLEYQPAFRALHRIVSPYGLGISKVALKEYAFALRHSKWQKKQEMTKLIKGGAGRLKLYKAWAYDARNDDPFMDSGIIW